MVEGQQLTILMVFLALWMVLYVLGSKYGEKCKRFELTIKPFFLQLKLKEINCYIDRISGIKLLHVLKDLSPPIAVLLSLATLIFLAQNLYNFCIHSSRFTGVTILIPFITLQDITLLTFFFLSIPLILIPHELAHAVIARLEGINLKSGGFAILGLLLAGFIEPDEEQFKKADPKKRLRVSAAGPAANLLIALTFFSLLLFQPATAIFMPDWAREAFYGPPSGVYVYLVNENEGIGKAGVRAGDVIKEVNGIQINSLDEYFKLNLKVGEEATVVVQRGKQLLAFTTTVIGEGDRGRLGFYGFTYYPPHIWVPPIPHIIFGFLFWAAYFSLMVGMFNMMPLYPFDGDYFFSSLFEIISDKKIAKLVRIGLNACTLLLFMGNIIATIVRMGFIVL